MYIPAIVKEFRPKCLKIDSNHKDELKRITQEWLEVTMELVENGLKSLDLVTNLRGLHIIREEALKIGKIDFFDRSPPRVSLLKSILVF